MIVDFCEEWIERRRKIPEDVVRAVEEFAVELTKEFPDVEVYLFGSYARGDWLRGSDIDLLIVSDSFEGISWVERSGRLRLLASSEHAFEILAYTREELKGKLSELGVVRNASKYWIKVVCRVRTGHSHDPVLNFIRQHQGQDLL